MRNEERFSKNITDLTTFQAVLPFSNQLSILSLSLQHQLSKTENINS